MPNQDDSTSAQTTINEVKTNPSIVVPLHKKTPVTFTVLAQNFQGCSLESEPSTVVVPAIHATRSLCWAAGCSARVTNRASSFTFSGYQDFTFELWLKVDELNDGRPPILCTMPLYGVSSKTAAGFCLRLMGGTSVGYSVSFGDGSTLVKLSHILPAAAQLNWHHVSVTCARRGDIVLYVDGGEVARTSAAGVQDLHGKNPLGIATDSTGLHKSQFSGRIRDVRVWKCRRTSEEIRAFLLFSITSPHAALLASYPMDSMPEEASSSLVVDLQRIGSLGRTPSMVMAKAGGQEMDDASGQRHTASVTGNPFIAPGPAVFGLGNGVELTEGSYGHVAHHADYRFGEASPFTVELWLRFGTTKWLNHASPIIGTSLDGLKSRGWMVHTVEDGRSWGATLSDGTSRVQVRSSIPINDNRWHHIAAIVDRANNFTLLQDGVVCGEVELDSVHLGDITTQKGIYLRYDTSARPALPLAVAEVRLWGHSRSVRQVCDGSRHRLQGGEFGLIGYWQFDQVKTEQIAWRHSQNSAKEVLTPNSKMSTVDDDERIIAIDATPNGNAFVIEPHVLRLGNGVELSQHSTSSPQAVTRAGHQHSGVMDSPLLVPHAPSNPPSVHNLTTGGSAAYHRGSTAFSSGNHSMIIAEELQQDICPGVRYVTAPPLVPSITGTANVVLHLPFNNPDHLAFEQRGLHVVEEVIGRRGGGLKPEDDAWRDVCARFDGQTVLRCKAFAGVWGCKARTVCCWVRIPAGRRIPTSSGNRAGAGGTIVSWGRPHSGIGHSNFGEGWSWSVQQNLGTAGTQCIDLGAGQLAATTNVCDGQWHHLAVVMQPPQASGRTTAVHHALYLDGRRETLQVCHSQIEVNTAIEADVRVGADLNGGDRFIGQLQDLRVFNRALSEAEITDLYESTMSDQQITTQQAIEFGHARTGGVLGISTNGGSFSSRLSVSSLSEEDRMGGVHCIIPHSPQLNFAYDVNFTIELWVRVIEVPTTGLIHIVGDKDLTMSASSEGVGIVLNAEAKRWAFLTGDGRQCVIAYGGNISDGEWHHLAVSADRCGSVTIYQDGVRLTSKAILHLGNVSSGNVFYVVQDGVSRIAVTELRVWRCTRSRDDVQNCMQFRLNGGEPDLAGYWKLNTISSSQEKAEGSGEEHTRCVLARGCRVTRGPQLYPMDEPKVMPAGTQRINDNTNQSIASPTPQPPLGHLTNSPTPHKLPIPTPPESGSPTAPRVRPSTAPTRPPQSPHRPQSPATGGALAPPRPSTVLGQNVSSTTSPPHSPSFPRLSRAPSSARSTPWGSISGMGTSTMERPSSARDNASLARTQSTTLSMLRSPSVASTPQGAKLLTALIRISPFPVTVKEIQQEFERHDVNGRKWLDRDFVKDLYLSWENFGVPESDDEIEDLLDDLNMNGDGRITLNEFTILCLRRAQR